MTDDPPAVPDRYGATAPAPSPRTNLETPLETALDTAVTAGGETEAATHRFEVSAEDVPCRLDVFLSSHFSTASRVRIRRGIDNGTTTVDGKVRKASFKLSAGQIVDFRLPPPPASGPKPEPLPITLLYEDEAIAVVDKPPGMIVHPAKGHWSGTLASALVHHFEHLSQHGGASRPGIVHRLDRDTSGVLVVAKTDEAHRNLAEQFQQRTVRKEYLAIVVGNPDRDRDRIDFPIGNHPKYRERKALRSGHASSREAETFYEVEERFKAFSLIRAFPKTGRTHQIRLHLVHIGCAVLCDKLYGGRSQLTAGELRTLLRQKNLAYELADEAVLLNRQALHAHRLHVTHPLTRQELEFTSPVPADMQKLLLVLREADI